MYVSSVLQLLQYVCVLQEDLHGTPSTAPCLQACVCRTLRVLTQLLRFPKNTAPSSRLEKAENPRMEARGETGKEALDTESRAVTFHSER